MNGVLQVLHAVLNEWGSTGSTWGSKWGSTWGST